MKTTALRFRTLALGLAMTGSIAASLEAIDVFTDPVGYYTLSLQGATDNVVALPMVRDAVFTGVVDNGTSQFTENSFDVLAGPISPGWTANQWVYAVGAQAQTYYVEFTTGALKGLYYKISANTANKITLEMEGDSLLNHPLPGNLTAALADGDSFKIRPFWRIRDVFEVNGAPIIEPRTNQAIFKDDVLIPNNDELGINKGLTLTYFYLQGTGWQKQGNEGPDFGDVILRPNEAIVVRRRNAAPLSLTHLGGVLMNRSVSFVPGGQTTKNDVYISIHRPAAISLNNSGLETVLTPTNNPAIIQDQLLAFAPGTGLNRTPSQFFYFLAGQPAGQGWRKVGNEDNVNIGSTFMLEPGTFYIVRKNANSAGKDWVNDPNY